MLLSKETKSNHLSPRYGSSRFSLHIPKETRKTEFWSGEWGYGVEDQFLPMGGTVVQLSNSHGKLESWWFWQPYANRFLHTTVSYIAYFIALSTLFKLLT